jgi:hypothetical protein
MDDRLYIVDNIRSDLVMFLREQRPIAARICLKTLFEVASDKNGHSSARVGAARALGEFAGVLGVGGAAGASKDPQDMSTLELHSQVQALERALADRAKVIGSTPDVQASLEQLIDLI